MNLFHYNKRAYTNSFLYTFFPIIALYIFHDTFRVLYNPKNHLSLHLSLELYSVFISFIIFIFGWKALVHNPPTTLLYIPFIFLSVGYFDFMHTLTYPGMPPLFSQGSISKSSWFWIAARATEALLLTIVLYHDENASKNTKRKTILSVTIIYMAIITVLVYMFGHRVPLLVIEGSGPTPFKNLLEYIFCGLHFVSISFVLKKLNFTKSDSHIYLMFAFILLIIGGIQFTLYKSVYDTENIIGHIYKAIGYTFIFRAFFYSNLHLTFINKEKAERNLVATKGILDSFFTHTPDSIALCDKNEKIVKVNAGFERLTCLESKDAIGKPIVEMFPSIQKQVRFLVKEVLNNKSFRDYEVESEENSIRMSITIFPIYNDEHIRFAVISRDITKIKKTEELLRKSEKLAVVGELAAGIAHEIRNPLTTLKGFTQMLGKESSEREKPFVDLMLSELNRIELITNEFMILAKPQSIKYQLHDLKKIVVHVLTIIEPQATLNNVEIRTTFTDLTVNIICDENQLKQVFINLIKNALESMPEGGELHVSIDPLQSDRVCICIKDTGCGIPEHVINRLGEPFYTLREKGTGLGLMVSFRIIEAHQGSIQFTSMEHKGTKVEILLPSEIV
ncbi:MAG TPA: MASE3 domain-containing protein [Metabacillus sp.]|nr:MASE3 domain-containing protein [Metabacillus sp.]